MFYAISNVLVVGSQDIGFASIPLNITTANTSYTPLTVTTSLFTDGTWYWRVRVEKPAVGEFSDVRSFPGRVCIICMRHLKQQRTGCDLQFKLIIGLRNRTAGPCLDCLNNRFEHLNHRASSPLCPLCAKATGWPALACST